MICYQNRIEDKWGRFIRYGYTTILFDYGTQIMAQADQIIIPVAAWKIKYKK